MTMVKYELVIQILDPMGAVLRELKTADINPNCNASLPIHVRVLRRPIYPPAEMEVMRPTQLAPWPLPEDM